MILLRLSKKALIKQLISVYGRNFKTKLATELGVDVSTVRRIFNTKDEIPRVYYFAIMQVIYLERHNANIS